MNLPPLPEPRYGAVGPYYDAADVRAYGQACAEVAADEIARLRDHLKSLLAAIEWQEGRKPHNLSTLGRAYWSASKALTSADRR